MLENEEKLENASQPEEPKAPAEEAAAPAAQPKKKKTGLIIGIVAPIAVILIGAIVALVLFLVAGNNATSAYQKGDYKAAYESMDLALFLDQGSKNQITKKYITDVLVAGKEYYKAVKLLETCGLSEKEQDAILASDENLKLCKANTLVKYGTYEQDGDFSTVNDDLEWIVLEVKEENGRAKALLMTKDVVGYTAGYNSKLSPKNTTYAGSEINSWCEIDFYNDFTMSFMEAKSVILKSKIVTAEGDETEAHVFILSQAELQKYLTGDMAQYLVAQGSNTARANGMTVYSSGAAGYFLRDQGTKDTEVCSVDRDGKINNKTAKSAAVGVRPCMWIDLGEI